MEGYVAKITVRDMWEYQHTAEVFIEKESFGRFMSLIVGRNLFSIEAYNANVEPGEYTLPIVDESTFGYYVKVVPKEYVEPRFVSEKEHEAAVKKWEVDNEVETMSENVANVIYNEYFLNPLWKKEEADVIIEATTK